MVQKYNFILKAPRKNRKIFHFYLFHTSYQQWKYLKANGIT